MGWTLPRKRRTDGQNNHMMDQGEQETEEYQRKDGEMILKRRHG